MNARKYSLTGSAVLLLMLAGGVQAQSAAQIVKQGNQAYQAGQYDEALKQYQRPLLEGPEDPVIQYNQANCYYKLDDLEQAIHRYRAVAAESRNMDLVARAKFNLGNCYFQQGMKQRDSDLQKAVEAFTTSIQQYREVLKIHPDDPDAAHNIEVIGLIMKDILDQLKKQQEQQKQQQQQQDLAEKIKKLLERQTELAGQTAQLPQNPPDPNQEDFNQLAEQQQILRKDTADVQTEAQQMIQQQEQSQAQAQENGQAVPDPNTAQKMEQNRKILDTVNNELRQATQHQQSAADQLHQTQPQTALDKQNAALENLQKALDAFPKQQQQQQQQEQKDQQEQQNQQQEQQKQQEQQEQQPQEDQQDQQQEPKQPQEEMQAPDATAQQILDEERRRKEDKEKARVGGYRPVERDW